MSDVNVTQLRRPATGTRPPTGFGSSATSRPTAQPGIDPWPKGKGYFSERPSTREWAGPIGRPSAPVVPLPSPNNNREAAKRALGFLGLIAIVLLVFLCVKYGNMLSRPADSGDDFWNNQTNSSQTNQSRTNTTEQSTSDTQPAQAPAVQPVVNTTNTRPICPDLSDPRFIDVQIPQECYPSST